MTDSIAPTFSEASVTSDDGAVDASCEEAVSYSVTVSDNCCLDPSNITITPSATNGSVKDLVVNRAPSTGPAKEVVVSGTFTVHALTGCPAIPSIEVEATDCCGNGAGTSESGDSIRDMIAPTFSIASLTADDGLVDPSCEEVVSYSVTVSDNCCLDPSNITITPSATNASVKDLVVDRSPSSGPTEEVVVSGTFTVYALSGCPAIPTLGVEAGDCCGNGASMSEDGSAIVDDEDPVVAGLDLPDDPLYVSEDCCSITIPYTATVTDNCCVDPNGAVAVAEIASTEHTAVLDVPPPTLTDMGGGTWSLTGSFTVSCLTGCPVQVRLTLSAADCCGNVSVEVWDEVTILDDTAPRPADDPNGYEESRVDGLEVRLHDDGAYRLMVRQDTPTYMDVIANDTDNCSSCGCCGTLWIEAIVEEPEYGEATIVIDSGNCAGGSRIRYAPDLGYIGPDEFTYTLRDACGNVSEPVTVRLLMIRQLEASNLYLTTCIGRSLEFEVVATDLWLDYEGADPTAVEFSFAIVSGPLHGILVGDFGDVTFGPPSTGHDPTSGGLVPSTTFTESASIRLEYASADGFVGRDELQIRFSDPFGGETEIVVDILVVDCGTERGAPSTLALHEGTASVILPQLFGAIVGSASTAMTLVSRMDGTTWETAASIRWDGTLARYVLTVEAAGLPPGPYDLTIPLGNGESVRLVVRAGEAS